MISPKKKKSKRHSTCNQSIENDVPILHSDKLNIKSIELQETLNGHKKKVHDKDESKYFCIFLNLRRMNII